MAIPSPKGQQAQDLYSAAEVAERLQCSPWWVKEQARKRRIPFSWIGGSYRFTPEHLAEIIRVFEVKPGDSVGVPGTVVARRGRAPRRPVSQQLASGQVPPVVRLTARPPRRARLSSHNDAA